MSSAELLASVQGAAGAASLAQMQDTNTNKDITDSQTAHRLALTTKAETNIQDYDQAVNAENKAKKDRQGWQLAAFIVSVVAAVICCIVCPALGVFMLTMIILTTSPTTFGMKGKSLTEMCVEKGSTALQACGMSKKGADALASGIVTVLIIGMAVALVIATGGAGLAIVGAAAMGAAQGVAATNLGVQLADAIMDAAGVPENCKQRRNWELVASIAQVVLVVAASIGAAKGISASAKAAAAAGEATAEAGSAASSSASGMFSEIISALKACTAMQWLMKLSMIGTAVNQGGTAYTYFQQGDAVSDKGDAMAKITELSGEQTVMTMIGKLSTDDFAASMRRYATMFRGMDSIANAGDGLANALLG